jgi:hypothetical protein
MAHRKPLRLHPGPPSQKPKGWTPYGSQKRPGRRGRDHLGMVSAVERNQHATRRTAVAALNRPAGRRIFRALGGDAQANTVRADDSKSLPAADIYRVTASPV